MTGLVTADGANGALQVERVLVVSKTHLDVGFTALASEVRRRYLDDFFPRAIATATELRARGGAARLRWTTGSWILTEALREASPAQRRRIESAVEAGDLCWHAMPFTLHTEYCERSLVRHGLSLSAALDRRFGHRTRAAKLTDVPGHTRGLVSLLAEAGVDLLHVGVNPAATAPEVPLQFRWRDPAALGGGADGGAAGGAVPEVLVMYQPGGYGAVQVVSGTSTAVAVQLTGDNLGPPDVQDVETAFGSLAEQFPGAAVQAATLDDVAAVMVGARSSLPALDDEIGDSWIHGVGSDPVKTAGFRALCRERVRWLDEGLAKEDDPALAAASDRLLLVGEHTWGLDQKTHWPEQGHWNASALAEARREESTRRFEASWAEQRAYLSDYVELLDEGGRSDLSVLAACELERACEVRRPSLDGLSPLDPSSAIDLGGLTVTLDPAEGSVASLVDPSGKEWTGAARLGRWWLQTFDAADYERWFGTYNSGTLPEDEGWARWDNTKPGLGASGARSARWPSRLMRSWAGPDVIISELALVADPADPVASPASVFQCIRRRPDGLEFELSWFGLPAARWPVASWWSFAPEVDDHTEWSLQKLGEPVLPTSVVGNGGATLHAVDAVVHRSGLSLELLDSPLVAPGAPSLLTWDDSPLDLSGGWHVCTHANLWGTNFPMWIEGDARFRVVMHLGS
jgi:hypothetical protein